MCEIQFRIVSDVKKRIRLYKMTEKPDYCIKINTYCTTNQLAVIIDTIRKI